MSGDTSFVYVVMFAMVLAVFLVLTALGNARTSTERLAEKVDRLERNARYSRPWYADEEPDDEGGSLGCLGTLLVLVIAAFLVIALLG